MGRHIGILVGVLVLLIVIFTVPIMEITKFEAHRVDVVCRCPAQEMEIEGEIREVVICICMPTSELREVGTKRVTISEYLGDWHRLRNRQTIVGWYENDKRVR